MRLLACLTFLLAAEAAHAQCIGTNLIDALPTDQRMALETAAAEAPFHEGNLWRATRGEDEIILVGTYHLDDPRHDQTFARLEPSLKRAATLLVEAGPEEEAALQAEMAKNPDRLFDFAGPPLNQALSPAEWEKLSKALLDRGLPPPMALKMRPWYLMVMVAIPACQTAAMAEKNGLDRRLIRAAQDHGIPIKALESWETIFNLMEQISPQDQLSLLIQSVDAGAGGADLAITLADSYFAGKNRLLWEFTQYYALEHSDLPDEEVRRGTLQMEEALISSRNRRWIAPMESAAADGLVLAAFGALHLSGDAGVLNLLAETGWTVTQLTP